MARARNPSRRDMPSESAPRPLRDRARAATVGPAVWLDPEFGVVGSSPRDVAKGPAVIDLTFSDHRAIAAPPVPYRRGFVDGRLSCSSSPHGGRNVALRDRSSIRSVRRRVSGDAARASRGVVAASREAARDAHPRGRGAGRGRGPDGRALGRGLILAVAPEHHAGSSTTSPARRGVRNTDVVFSRRPSPNAAADMSTVRRFHVDFDVLPLPVAARGSRSRRPRERIAR